MRKQKINITKTMLKDSLTIEVEIFENDKFGLKYS